MYIGIITNVVIKISIQASKFRKSLKKPAKNKLTKPSKLYKIIDLGLKRFIITFYF